MYALQQLGASAAGRGLGAASAGDAAGPAAPHRAVRPGASRHHGATRHNLTNSGSPTASGPASPSRPTYTIGRSSPPSPTKQNASPRARPRELLQPRAVSETDSILQLVVDRICRVEVRDPGEVCDDLRIGAACITTVTKLSGKPAAGHRQAPGRRTGAPAARRADTATPPDVPAPGAGGGSQAWTTLR
ncbi:hypothetical protein GCM10010277_79020 [Streptomyces longisporoflavus]|nr:hypothetical protein GCM10010277_79020 [Streptomyces longisporoflavus]